MDRILNPVAQEEIIFHATSKSSSGEKTLMQVTLGPKGGNPLHYHRKFSEKFTVIDGELSVQVEKNVHRLKKGDTIMAGVNQRHRFFNASGKPVSFYCELNPASEGFENVLRIAFGMSNEGLCGPNGMPKSLMVNGILMHMGEGTFVGFFSVVAGIFKLFGSSEKATQKKQELLEKYCRQ
jgi:quercetin dioxygenase-like cupin family protein